MYRKAILITLLLQWPCAYGADQTLLQCSQIKNSTQRVACYDKLAKKVRQQLGDQYSGSAKQRQEARDASITNTVVNIKEQDAAAPPLTIKQVFTDSNQQVTYLTSDGRYFRPSGFSPVTIPKGARVHIKHGVLNSTFLESNNMSIKVRQVK